MNEPASLPDDNATAPGAKAPTSAPDWEAVSGKYRAGLLSIRQIAKQHGVTEGAIRKRAKKDGWQRDLTAKVQEAVRIELARTAVRTEAPATGTTEREIVAEAAAQVVHLLREHRTDIRSHRALLSTLLEQLNFTAENRAEIERAIIDETAEADDTEATKGEQQAAWVRRGQMLRAVSLPQNASTLKDLAQVLKTVIGLEREAFSVANVPEKPPADEEVSRNDLTLARIEQIFQRAHAQG